MQLMLCIKGTPRTNTVAGLVYESVGHFTCPHCGKVSVILEFAPPVQEWLSITCHGCNRSVDRVGRYAHQKRFIPLNDPDALTEIEEVREECTT